MKKNPPLLTLLLAQLSEIPVAPVNYARITLNAKACKAVNPALLNATEKAAETTAVEEAAGIAALEQIVKMITVSL